jgi:hypothetical protein
MGHVIQPTESRLRKYFLQFGSMMDVQINYYNSSVGSSAYSPTSHGGSGMRQEGYGFITFEESSAAEAVLIMGTHNVDGIEVICSFSTERTNIPGVHHKGHRNVANNNNVAKQSVVPITTEFLGSGSGTESSNTYPLFNGWKVNPAIR